MSDFKNAFNRSNRLSNAFRENTADMKSFQKYPRWAAVGILVVALLSLMHLAAEPEKKGVDAHAAAENASVEAAPIAKKKGGEDTAEDAKRSAGVERDFEIVPGVKLTMCWIPAGEFVMGNSQAKDATPYSVKITKGFWLSQTEVTQAQWQAIMGNNPSHFKGRDLPVECVSWNDIYGNEERTGGFLGKLNQRHPKGGRFDLPTEAQWEYACGAGNAEAAEGDLDANAWYDRNSGQKTHPVGKKKSNAWGLHDMLGNVWEWCADWKGDFPKGSVSDPVGADWGTYRVNRGGSWISNGSYCVTANRNYGHPAFAANILGFRVARSAEP